MTAETSNARWDVVAWFPTNAQGEIIRNHGDGSPVYACRTKEEAEQAKRCHLGATGPVIPLYAAPPPPADAEPKTLPVPTHVYLTDKAAVIVGDPQRGWDEEGPDAHNCDAMGCATFGQHVLARVPFTDERALSQPAEAQGGGEVVARGFYDPMTGAYSESQHTPRWLPAVVCTAPPSAPVGVELSALRVQEWLHREHDILCPVQEIEQAMRTPCSCPFTERALAQQPAARPPKPTECMNGCPDRQVCDHCQWPPGPDQQPAAVDDAMELVRDIAEQKPEKPDYWSSCGQCESNIDRAQEVLATQRQEPKS